MKDTRGACLTEKAFINYHKKYDLYASRTVVYDSDSADCEVYKDFSCQYDSKRDNVICTCKRSRNTSHRKTRKALRAPDRYSASWRPRSNTDIAVGSVKASRRRTRRIYLPETRERGVECLNPFQFTTRRNENNVDSYCEQKKTSSKCVGSAIALSKKVGICEKLSPFVHTKSGTTSPVIFIHESNDEKQKCDSALRVNCRVPIIEEFANVKEKSIEGIKKGPISGQKEEILQNNKASPKSETKTQHVETMNDLKDFSSDSLVQHIHDLEFPSFDKHSRTSIDIIENEIEREYINMFASKKESPAPVAEKLPPNLKSSSVLKRRFEALRRGFQKKQDSCNHTIVENLPAQESTQSHKDVSIASDPPSLEARSYSKTKIYSPYVSFIHPYKFERSTTDTNKRSQISKTYDGVLSNDVIDNEQKGVKGMFNLWGKKFNLENDNSKEPCPNALVLQKETDKQTKKVEIVEPKRKNDEDKKCDKKGVKKFSFFKKRTREKAKEVFQPNVTTGRCEVKDGLTIKIDGITTKDISPPNSDKCNTLPDNYNSILCKTWLKQFLTNNVDSCKSVQLRWNNEMYSRSSSTVSELLECVYRNTNLVITSSSTTDSTTVSSSYFRNNKTRVKFIPKQVEAWMIPKTIFDTQFKTVDLLTKSTKGKRISRDNIKVSYSGKKWVINKFADGSKMEIVLNSKNFVSSCKDESSEYIFIDISKGFLSDANNEQSSDEEVYKITDYESPCSNTYLYKHKNNGFEIGDHVSNNIQVSRTKDNKQAESIDNTKNKRPPLRRDVVIQGSQVYIGIITQRDIMRDIKKPILQIHDDILDEESSHGFESVRKCPLAESYLQDYYRDCIPMGMDLFSCCASDSQVKCSFINNSLNSLNQGDGSKSCPNIYDEYGASNIVLSCGNSSCSQCMVINEVRNTEEKKASYFGKLTGKTTEINTDKRILPKDSIEVFKRRKIYAKSHKSCWNSPEFCSKTDKASSLEKLKPTLIECPKSVNECLKPPIQRNKKCCKKRVMLPDCEELRLNTKESLLNNKKLEGILSFKGSTEDDSYGNQNKQTRVTTESNVEIPQAPCQKSCLSEKSPPCSKKNSPSCVPKPRDSPKSPVASQNMPFLPPVQQNSCRRCCQGQIIKKKCSIETKTQCPYNPKPQSSGPCRTSSQSICSPKPCMKPSQIPPKTTKGCSPSISPQTRCPHIEQCPNKTKLQPTRPCLTSPKISATSSQIIFCPKQSSSPKPCPKCLKTTNDSSPARSPQHGCTHIPEKCPPDAKLQSLRPWSVSPPLSVTSSQGNCCQKQAPCPKPLQTPKTTKVCSPSRSPKNDCPHKRVPCPIAPNLQSFRPCSTLPSLSATSSRRSCCSTQPPCPNLRKPTPKTTKRNGHSKSPQGSSIRIPRQCPYDPKPQPNFATASQTSPIENTSCTKCQHCCTHTSNDLAKIKQKLSDTFKKICNKLSSYYISRGDQSRSTKIPCPSTPPSVSCPDLGLQQKCCSQNKILGLKLTKTPKPNSSGVKKINACDKCRVIRLNSTEKITINIKDRTPSTEEIRNNFDIKVQDDDGITLFERKDYHTSYKHNTAQTNVIQDLYRDSYIHRLSTPNILNNAVVNSNVFEMQNKCSDLIEINLSIKLKQADKTAPLNDNNHTIYPKGDLISDIALEKSKEVFVVKDQCKEEIENNDNNDININIIIKNSKANEKNTYISSKKKHQPKDTDNISIVNLDPLTRKISEKFQIDSTGYKDVISQAYSVKTSHTDLKNEEKEEELKKPSYKDLLRLDETLLTVSSISITERTATEDTLSSFKTNDENIDKIDKSEKFGKSSDTISKLEEINNEKSELALTDIEKNRYKCVAKIPYSYKEKKDMLIKLMEQTSKIKKPQNSAAMKEIRERMHEILASGSSCNENVSERDNKSIEELADVKPDIFKHSDSLQNLQNAGNSISEVDIGKATSAELVYPSEENSNENSDETEESEGKNQHCMCRAMAARLQFNAPGAKPCCCGVSIGKDKEILCDLINSNKSYLIDMKTNYVDVETQNSKYSNSIKQHSIRQTILMTNVSAMVQIKSGEIKRDTFDGFDLTSEAVSTGSVKPFSTGLRENDISCLANILQSNETKRAVLKIYAEKKYTESGPHIVAKLPKFTVNKESEIFQEIKGHKRIEKRNIMLCVD
ncbi:unnamed protein product [Leptidea sinapis]|uniref:Uncharacterized protein n=1 Tax=Leptidea sinapis TaxID=189913 RepID=A0A5E4R4X6_9NEOP|nr:unnamed protein product [Leptidea sinapis]